MYFHWCKSVDYSDLKKIFLHTHFMKQVLKELISFIFRNGFIQDAAKNAVIEIIKN